MKNSEELKYEEQSSNNDDYDELTHDSKKVELQMKINKQEGSNFINLCKN